MFKRKIYEYLLNWKKESKGTKALLIEGARRIGKSTVSREFGKNEYKSFVIIDFSTISSNVKNYFNDYLSDLNTFFLLISTEFKTELYYRDTLFIFDEVQTFPKAREAIKTLVSDGRYDYIETGSLISIRDNVKDILIPSEERSIKMFPMDFEEFCWAMGEHMLIEYIKKCFNDKKSMDERLHSKAMLLFKQYMLVGGMPKSVDAYISNNYSFLASDIEKRDILSLYRKDINKIEAQYKSKVISIYDQIPGLLSRHEKRIVFKELGKGTYFDQYEETFFWLSDSMITNECFLCNDPNIGLSINENRTYIKCYFGDTGLLVSHAFTQKEIGENELYKKILGDNLSFNKGMLYENVIAQMLVANGHKLFFYSHYNNEKKRNDIEIDFILSNGKKTNFKVNPIEVKSSKQYKYNSLINFNNKFDVRIENSFIIHPKNLQVKENIICIPPYMVICL